MGCRRNFWGEEKNKTQRLDPGLLGGGIESEIPSIFRGGLRRQDAQEPFSACPCPSREIDACCPFVLQGRAGRKTSVGRNHGGRERVRIRGSEEYCGLAELVTMDRDIGYDQRPSQRTGILNDGAPPLEQRRLNNRARVSHDFQTSSTRHDAQEPQILFERKLLDEIEQRARDRIGRVIEIPPR